MIFNAVLSSSGGTEKEEQEKSVTITENGTTEITPDSGKTLSKVMITTNVTGGGSGESKLPQVVDRTVTEITAEDLQGLTGIGAYAFHSCVNLMSATIPSGVNSIGSYAFYDCSSLTRVMIPDGVTYIGINAFYNCSALESVLIPSSVANIGNTAFSKTGLLSIEIPDSVTRLGGTVFSSCTKLKSAIIGNGVTAIDTAAFQSCTSLNNVTIGQAVTTIKGNAFNNCSALVDIRIPANVTNIEGNALKIGSNTNKAVIRMEPRTPPTITTRTFDTTKLDSILVHSGCLDAYKSATNWASLASYIKEGLG